MLWDLTFLLPSAYPDTFLLQHMFSNAKHHDGIFLGTEEVQREESIRSESQMLSDIPALPLTTAIFIEMLKCFPICNVEFVLTRKVVGRIK